MLLSVSQLGRRVVHLVPPVSETQARVAVSGSTLTPAISSVLSTNMSGPSTPVESIRPGGAGLGFPSNYQQY